MTVYTVQDAASAQAPALARLLTDAYLGQWVYTPEHVTRRLEAVRPGRFTLSAFGGQEVRAGLDADPPSAPSRAVCACSCTVIRRHSRRCTWRH